MKPGSKKAVAAGCTCPTLQPSGKGKVKQRPGGRPLTGRWYADDCPVHVKPEGRVTALVIDLDGRTKRLIE